MYDPLRFNLLYDLRPTDIGAGYAADIEQAGGIQSRVREPDTTPPID